MATNTVAEINKQLRLFVPCVIDGDGISADHESCEPTSETMEAALDDGSPCGIAVDNTNEKPPLGLRPKAVWLAARKAEVAEAIDRYMQAGTLVPREWILELNSLKNYHSSMS